MPEAEELYDEPEEQERPPAEVEDQHDEESEEHDEEAPQTPEEWAKAGLNDEEQAVLQKAIEAGVIVDYSRFKSIYGALKHAERELQARETTRKIEPEPTPPAQTSEKPKQDDFETWEEYQEALVDWKVDQREAQREQRQAKKTEQQRLQESQQGWDDQVAAAIAKDSEFTAKGFIDTRMVPQLMGTQRVADFAYYFAENREESDRILRLSPVQQARELGKLEAQFENNKGPPRRTRSKAPAPTKPSGTGQAGGSKDPDKMTPEEYRAWRQSGGGK